MQKTLFTHFMEPEAEFILLTYSFLSLKIILRQQKSVLFYKFSN